MKLILLSVFNLLFLSSFGRGDTLSPSVIERVQALTLEGFNSAYNFDFANANKSFDLASGVEPLHPRPYVGKTTIELWRYLLSRDDTARKSFLAYADRAIDVAEQYEDRFGEDAESKLCLGTIYGYRAFVNGRAKSYLKAAWDGKKSYDYYYDALQRDPQTYDAYLGLGIFHYFMDFLPKPMKWIASIMGIGGDARTGLREIRVAAEKGKYCKVEAQYYLAQFAPWMDGDFNDGEKILENLTKQYPSNTLFTFTLAVWEIRRNDIRSARDRLASIVEKQKDPMGGVIRYAKYKLAECYFYLGMYRNAREIYQSFLRDYRDETYRATSNYRIAVCFEMTGRRDSALAYYRIASRSDRKFGDDMYSARRAELRLKSPISVADSLLIAAENTVHSGEYDNAISISSQAAALTGISSDLILEVEFVRAEAYYEKKSYQEALRIYRLILTKNIERELWLHPWSHYQSGLCLLKLNDPAGAKKEFEQTLEYEDYDFNNWLEFRARREIEKIENNR